MILHDNHKAYLEWWNDFLSIEGYANYYDIGYHQAHSLIRKGRIIHNSQFGEPLSDIAVRHH